jgi:hypothetical protein
MNNRLIAVYYVILPLILNNGLIPVSRMSFVPINLDT